MFPVTTTGASTLTSPSSDDACGERRIPTTPVGSGTLKLKNGPATGLDDPTTCATLSAQPRANQTQRSTAASTLAAASSRFTPSLEGHLIGELGAPAVEHLGDAVEDLSPVVGGRAGPAGLRLARRYDADSPAGWLILRR